ncbi:MAG: aminopeptidase [Oscillospiraceae bacterium]|nr:aminopeptidase [Oscillospiraceae bacterium]
MEKNDVKKLQKKLLSQKGSSISVGRSLDDNAISSFSHDYIEFLNNSKTEREAVASSVEFLKERGFVPFDPDKKYRPGDKAYWVNHQKSLIAFIVGSESLEKGTLITAAHIDSPRLDLKPRPLYEEASLAYFRTHYYGGIKKYQWTAIPLSIHGVVVLSDGREISVFIGEDDLDPVFYISDLLPHLSRKSQAGKTMGEIIVGEQLNVILGSKPIEYNEEIKDPVKLNVLHILNEKYDIVEDDLISAELEIVPAMTARYVGFDKSMIASYGQDDRVCAYTGLRALAELNAPKKTCILVLADKEEIGSVGNTGMNSDMLRNFITLLSHSLDVIPEKVFINSKCLSADVNVAYDPNFAEVYERQNTAYLNCGPTLSKYTGSGGKGGSNDASAEFLGEVRNAFDSEDVPWQIGELGKVDEGGGGTVAQFVSRLGIDTIDIGVGLLSMHSPYELSSCFDVYALFKAVNCFFRLM